MDTDPELLCGVAMLLPGFSMHVNQRAKSRGSPSSDHVCRTLGSVRSGSARSEWNHCSIASTHIDEHRFVDEQVKLRTTFEQAEAHSADLGITSSRI